MVSLLLSLWFAWPENSFSLYIGLLQISFIRQQFVVNCAHRQWFLEVSQRSLSDFGDRKMRCCPRTQRSRASKIKIQSWLLHVEISPDFLNLLMIMTIMITADDEIFKVIPILCWGTLFWNWFTICRQSFLQIGEFLSNFTSEIFCPSNMLCIYPVMVLMTVANYLISCWTFLQLFLFSISYFSTHLLPCLNCFETCCCHQIQNYVVFFSQNDTFFQTFHVIFYYMD